MPYLEIIQVIFTIIRDVFTCLAALTAAGTGVVVAILGFRTWKQQLHWKTEYELAQRFLRATYRVRDAITELRNPLSLFEQGLNGNAIVYGKQFDKPFRDVTEAEESTAYFQKWQGIQSLVADLDTIAVEGEAIWGDVVAEKMKPLKRFLWSLSQNAQTYASYTSKPSLIAFEEKLLEVAIKVVRDLESIGSKDGDDFAKELTAAVKQIEKFLKPYLKI